VTDANKRANVASELARADESMRAARILVDAALLHDAESRLSYAIYHAAVALLPDIPRSRARHHRRFPPGSLRRAKNHIVVQVLKVRYKGTTPAWTHHRGSPCG